MSTPGMKNLKPPSQMSKSHWPPHPFCCIWTQVEKFAYVQTPATKAFKLLFNKRSNQAEFNNAPYNYELCVSCDPNYSRSTTRGGPNKEQDQLNSISSQDQSCHKHRGINPSSQISQSRWQWHSSNLVSHQDSPNTDNIYPQNVRDIGICSHWKMISFSVVAVIWYQHRWDKRY